MILLLSETARGRLHDKRLAEATPSPFPVASRLVQALSFLAFTRLHVETLMSTKAPCDQGLPVTQQRTNQALHHIGSGSSMSTAASSAVRSSKAGTGCGGTVSAI